jgi:ABC-type sugar transport system ATPase subunit
MIAVDNLAVRAGAFAFDGLSFTVATGEYAVLIGKTGCGKTTLLEATGRSEVPHAHEQRSL